MGAPHDETVVCIDLCRAGEGVLFLSPDTRIHNRAALAERYGQPASVAVADLLRAMFAAKGAAMVSELRGAFAFALWDERRAQVFAARDIFGLCPFYYSQRKNHLVFGVSSRGVRRALGVPTPQDSAMLAQFISGTFTDAQATFFEGVYRLPCAHWARFAPGTATLHRYWTAQGVTGEVDNGADPVETFRTLFRDSVRRDWVPGDTALTLSGGLDSSAIIDTVFDQSPATTRQPALAMSYAKTEGWTDGPCIDAVAKSYPLDVSTLPSDGFDPLADMPFWLDVLDGPYLAYGHAVSAQLWKQTQALGLSRMLSGHGGDEIVSYGLGRVNELAKAGRWGEVWKNAPAVSAMSGKGQLAVFSSYLRHNRAYRFVHDKLRAIARRVRTERKSQDAAPLGSALLSEDLRASVIGLETEMAAPYQSANHTERSVHETFVGSALQSIALEVYALCGQAVGVRTRMPFYDQDLLEHCLRLPARYKLRDGYSRWVLRQAMSERMPDIVRRRRDKFDFAPSFIRGLVADRERLLRLTDPAHEAIASLVNPEAVNALRDKVRNEHALSSVEAFALWRIAVLRLWQSRPEAQPA